MVIDEQGNPIKCTKCESDNVIRSGMSRDKQRYFCKNCRSFFVPKTLVERREAVTKRKAAMLMYLAGAQIKEMEKVFGVSYPTISKWIEPIQKMIDSDEDLKVARNLGDAGLEHLPSAKTIQPQSRKNWLIIELDDDHFEGRNVMLSHK